MIMILESIESYDKRLLELKIPRSGNFGPKMEKSGFLRGRSKFEIFWNLIFQYLYISIISVVSKFEQKWIKTLDFTAHSIFKGFDLKILIFGKCAMPKWPQFLTQAPTTMNVCQNVSYMYMLKVKKFQEWTYQTKYRGCINIPPPGI